MPTALQRPNSTANRRPAGADYPRRLTHNRRRTSDTAAALATAAVVRLLALVLGAVTLAVSYPRRNPGASVWNEHDLAGHTLGEHVARLGDRGRPELYLPGGPDTAFPLYRWLVSGLQHATGLPAWAAATALSLAAVIATAPLLVATVRRIAPHRFDALVAWRAALLWLMFPGAALLGWIAPWSLLALLVTATWWAAASHRSLLAAVLAALAALTHPLGIIALAFVTLTPWGSWRRTRTWVALALAAAIVGSGLTTTGCARGCRDAPSRAVAAVDPLAGPHMLAASIDELLLDDVDLRAEPRRRYGDQLSRGVLNLGGLAAIAFLAAMVPLTWRRVDAGAAVACAAAAVALLAVPSPTVPWVAAPHLVAVATPAFAALALWTSATHTRVAATIIVLATMFGGVTAAATLWQWVD